MSTLEALCGVCVTRKSAETILGEQSPSLCLSGVHVGIYAYLLRFQVC